MNQEPKKRTGGRLKGSPNKITASVKQRISILIDRNWKQMQKDMDSMAPKDRVLVIANLLPYVIPKLASSTNDISIKQKLEDMSAGQLEKVVDQILNEDTNEH